MQLSSLVSCKDFNQEAAQHDYADKTWFTPQLSGWINQWICCLSCTLSFEENHDYNYLCKLLCNLCTHEGHQYDQVFNQCSLLNTCLDDQRPSINVNSKKTIFKKDDAGRSHSSHVYVYRIWVSLICLDRICSHTAHQHLLVSLALLHTPFLLIDFICQM